MAYFIRFDDLLPLLMRNFARQVPNPGRYGSALEKQINNRFCRDEILAHQSDLQREVAYRLADSDFPPRAPVLEHVKVTTKKDGHDDLDGKEPEQNEAIDRSSATDRLDGLGNESKQCAGGTLWYPYRDQTSCGIAHNGLESE